MRQEELKSGIEERAIEYTNLVYEGTPPESGDYDYGLVCDAYIRGANEQKAIDKELIEMLIGELYTSRAYHLGITGLDSDAEIAQKVKEGDCALIRGIDRTINYVKKALEE